jgi:hypothetical protein
MTTEINEDTLKKTGCDAVEYAKTIAITSDADFNKAGEALVRIKRRIKEVADFFSPMKQAADRAKREILDKERSVLAPFETAKQIISSAVQLYNDELNRVAAEKFKADRAAALKIAEDARIAEAVAAEQRGDNVMAERLVTVPVVPAAVPHPRTAPKVAGLSFRTEWRFEITDSAIVPPEFKVVDESLVRAAVKQQKEACKIPGIRVWSEQVPVGR